MSNRKAIRLAVMEENFLNNFKPSYAHIRKGFLREIFTKVPNRMFPNLVREFYSNINIKNSSLNSIVKGIEIDIYRNQVGRMLGFLFYGVSYAYNVQIKSKFKVSITINSFIMNLMDDIKFPIKVRCLKATIHVVDYLITRILHPRKDNFDVIIKEDVIHMWLLNQKFQNN